MSKSTQTVKDTLLRIDNKALKDLKQKDYRAFINQVENGKPVVYAFCGMHELVCCRIILNDPRITTRDFTIVPETFRNDLRSN